MNIMRLSRTAGILLCAGVLLGTSQCQQQDDKTDGSPLFVTTLSLQDSNGTVQNTFTTGQAVVLKLTVYNRSDVGQTLWFNTSELYNFVVVNQGTATTVWNWSAQQAFNDSFTKLVFQPHETQNFTVNWDQTDNNGLQLQAGQYEIFGGLTMYNRGGQNNAADNGDAMAQDEPTPAQMMPTQYRSALILFTLD